MLFFLLIGVGVILWSVWGYVSSRVEVTEYTVIQEANGYEVRRYPARIVAEAKIPGTGMKALDEGFKAVFDFISGANTKDVKIAMTAPVMATSETGGDKEKSWTATYAEGETIVAFGMPKEIVPETLPIPIDPRLSVVTRPETIYAALRFRGFRSDARIQAKQEALLEKLKRDGKTVLGAATYAGYDAPGTPPWMTRHEVLVPIAA